MSRSTPDRDPYTFFPMISADRYADLIVRVGANVQPGQILFGKARPLKVVETALRIQNANATNWTVAAFPNAGWAEQVLGEPDVDRLWDAIARTVRLDEDDPVAAWREHTKRMRSRCKALDALALDALHFHGGGDELT